MDTILLDPIDSIEVLSAVERLSGKWMLTDRSNSLTADRRIFADYYQVSIAFNEHPLSKKGSGIR